MTLYIVFKVTALASKTDGTNGSHKLIRKTLKRNFSQLLIVNVEYTFEYTMRESLCILSIVQRVATLLHYWVGPAFSLA